MTEPEWLACNDPLAILQAAGPRATERKVRLFCVGCCRQVLPRTPAAKRRSAAALLGVAERVADGRATKAERLAADRRARGSYSMMRYPLAARCTPADAFYAARHAGEFAEHGANGVGYATTQAALVALARDLFGPLDFRAVALDPNGLTPAVTALPHQAYESGDFSPMPVLADALQEAGCDDPDLLGHCRGPGPHARGCWAIDLILGKV